VVTSPGVPAAGCISGGIHVARRPVRACPQVHRRFLLLWGRSSVTARPLPHHSGVTSCGVATVLTSPAARNAPAQPQCTHPGPGHGTSPECRPDHDEPGSTGRPRIRCATAVVFIRIRANVRRSLISSRIRSHRCTSRATVINGWYSRARSPTRTRRVRNGIYSDLTSQGRSVVGHRANMGKPT
jgi:hypothetical protein